jgi:PAS domain S-box-containing protein
VPLTAPRHRAIGVLTALLLAWMGYYTWSSFGSYEQRRADTIRHGGVHAQQLSDALGEQTALLISGIDLALLSLRDSLGRDSSAQFDADVRATLAAFPDRAIEMIRVIDDKGAVVYSSRGRHDEVTVRDLALLPARPGGDHDGLRVGKPELDRSANRWSVQFARTLSRAGRPAGVIVASFDPRYLSKSLSAMQLDPADAIGVVYADGAYLARVPDPVGALGRAVPGDRPFLGEKAPERGNLRATAAFDGEPRSYAWTRGSSHGFIAVVGLSERALLAPVEEAITRSVRRHIASGLIFVGLIGLAVVLMLRQSRQQSRLEASEARLRGIVESSFDGILAVDAQGRIVLANGAAEKTFGRPATELVGSPLDLLIPARFRSQHGERLSDFATGGEPTSGRMGRASLVTGLRHDGSEFPAEVSLSRTSIHGEAMMIATIRDATERVQADALIRESEQRFRDLVETTDGVVWEADAKDLRYTFVSRNGERMLGYAIEEWRAPDFWASHLHPDDRAWAPHFSAAHTAQLEPHLLEYRLLAKNGRIVWVRDQVTVVGEQGRPRWLRGVMVDITESKQREASLRESEMRWRFALEGAGDGVWDWNVPEDRVFFSHRWKEMLGYADDEIGDGLDEWKSRVHPDDLDKTLAAIQAHFKDDTAAYSDEHRVRCKDGTYKWILDRGIIVARDGDDRPLRMIGTHTDITSLKETASALRAASQLNREIIASAREGIIVYGPDLRYQVWNAYMQHFTGMRADEVLGRHPQEVFPFLEGSGVIERLLRALAGAIPDPIEFPFEVAETGQRGWASDQCAPLRDADGRIIGVIGTVHDISARKAAELRLIEANDELEHRVEARTAALEAAMHKAEAANRTKSAFLANISHEMRTPMTAIIGMTELMRRSPLDSSQAERLAKIGYAAEHLLGIINDLLDLARIEAGKLPIDAVEFGLGDLLADAHALVRQRAEQKGLPIDIRHDGVPERLVGDPQRLRQALVNYLMNAVKFTERGSISVRVTVGSAPNASSTDDRLPLRFEVRDTGPGIPAATLARLFNAFEQADNSFTREHGGTGLGLAIVRQIAGLMGGEAGVASREGEGSTFWFTATLRRPNAAGASEADPGQVTTSPPTDSLRGCRVLVVDDDEINREVITTMLETMDLSIDIACDGLAAIERTKSSRYDLVLMDLHMPRMSGLDAAREIRRQPDGSRLPIIALTGDSPVTVDQQCRDAGMDGVVGKPFRLEDLARIARQWIVPRDRA